MKRLLPTKTNITLEVRAHFYARYDMLAERTGIHHEAQPD